MSGVIERLGMVEGAPVGTFKIDSQSILTSTDTHYSSHPTRLDSTSFSLGCSESLYPEFIGNFVLFRDWADCLSYDIIAAIHRRFGVRKFWVHCHCHS